MAVQQVIIADLNVNCGYARISDNSVYLASPNSRADFGIAIFVEENGSLNYSLSDFTNSDPWYIPITNHIPYVVHAIQVPVWVAGVNYAALSIVYHNDTGLFYQNTSGGGSGGVEPGQPGWTEMTNDLVGYNSFMAIGSSGADISLQQDCPDYILSKVECDDIATCCKTWRVCDNSGNLTVKQVSLFDYNGNYISTTILDPATSLCVDIVLTTSGTFIVGIRDKPILDTEDGPTILSNYTEFLVIYEYCQLSHCAQYLLDQILCSNDPCEEVCNPCSQDKILKQQNARTEINRMSWMFLTLMGMINSERIKYLGLYGMDTTRLAFVTRIGLYLTKINEIAIRCGICTSANVTASDNPVFQNVIDTSTNRSSGCTECNQ